MEMKKSQTGHIHKKKNTEVSALPYVLGTDPHILPILVTSD